MVVEERDVEIQAGGGEAVLDAGVAAKADLGAKVGIAAKERPPRAPFESRSTPGMKRISSPIVRAPELSTSRRSSTVTEAVAEDSGRACTVAVSKKTGPAAAPESAAAPAAAALLPVSSAGGEGAAAGRGAASCAGAGDGIAAATAWPGSSSRPIAAHGRKGRQLMFGSTWRRKIAWSMKRLSPGPTAAIGEIRQLVPAVGEAGVA
jgi:hypothetical protein